MSPGGQARQVTEGAGEAAAGRCVVRMILRDAPLPADFSQPFAADNPLFPLGATPLLASEATLDASGQGSARLTLREARERHLTLDLNGELLQALCAMLRAASEQACWELALDYQPLARHPVAGHGNGPSTLLH